jgi:hypothetical protein
MEIRHAMLLAPRIKAFEQWQFWLAHDRVPS